MSINNIQTSFIAGELSPALFGRNDDQLLSYGAEDITNFIVRKTGTLIKRSGLQFVHDFGDQECRLEEFRFASDQTLVLVFAPNKLYFASKQGLVIKDGAPYSISTPYAKEDLWSLSFSQNADVVTITSAKHPPRELRRYGGTDWRFADLKTKPDIRPPSSFSGYATYPSFTPEDKDDKDPNAGTYDIIRAQYKVTAVDKDGAESEPSSSITVKCNYYITGATVELSWSSVSDADYYRVYRAVSGIYGFLGQTETTSMSDTGTTPDTAMTPPSYKAPFEVKAGGSIVDISVLDGGHGYYDNTSDGGYIYVAGFPEIRAGRRNNSIAAPSCWVEVTLKGSSNNTLGTVKIPYVKYYEDYKAYEQPGDTPISGHANYWFAPSKEHVGALGIGKIPITSIPRFSQATKIEIRGFAQGSHNYFEFGRWTKGDTSTDYTDMSLKFNKYVDSRRWHIEGDRCNAELVDVKHNSDGSDSSAGRRVVVPLTITDSQGSGATAEAYAVDGVIRSVSVTNGGRNYYSPTVSAHGVGSGARFLAKLSSSSDAEYPTCSGKFDQRRVFAGSLKNPLKLWMTNAGSQNLMTVHTPLQDDDRIEIVALASDADMIKHIVAMDSLILFTGSSEMRVLSQSGVMSPKTIGVRAQSYVGANGVQPVVAKNIIVYVSARGAHPQGLSYAESSGLYMSQDLGVRCSHLFDGNDIIDLALAKTPEQLLLAVSTNGTLLVCNFLPEQQVNAWSKIKTDGHITSVCAVAEGVEDKIYLMVKRIINGEERYYLECLGNSLYDSDEDARCLDSFAEHTFDDPVDNISGLQHLNGKTVVVVGDGEAQSPKVVVDGKVKLDKKALHVVVGMPYVSQVVSVPLDYRAPEAIMAARNVANEIKLRVTHSGNIKCSRYPALNDNDLYLCKRDTALEREQNYKSKILTARVAGGWGQQCQVLLRNDDHLPLEIAALLVDLGYLKGKG